MLLRCSFASFARRRQWIVSAALTLSQAQCVVKIEGLSQRPDRLAEPADAHDDSPVARPDTSDVVGDSVTDAVDVASRDVVQDASPNVVIVPPATRVSPQLPPRRCRFSADFTDVFADRISLGTTPGRGAHALTASFRGMSSGREWLAAWAGNDGALHEVRAPIRGSVFPSIYQRVGVPNVEQLWIDGRNSGAITSDRYFLRAESGPTLTSLTTSWFVGMGYASYVRLTEGRLLGSAAFLGDVLWVPTVRVEDVLGGTRTTNARVERLVPRSPDTISDAVSTTAQTLAPQVVQGDATAWLGFIDDSSSAPNVSVVSLDRSTAAPNARPSTLDDSGECRATAFHLTTAANVPVAIESCEGNGLRLTHFQEQLRRNPPLPTTRTFVRDKDAGISRSIRARVAFNGAELAVVWVDPSDQTLSVRFFVGTVAQGPRLRIFSPEPALESTIDVQALPTENGTWAVLWSTERATYLSRFGRCGTNPPGEN
jgi:hypothetical protein